MQNKKIYWLRGGVISLTILIIFFVIADKMSGSCTFKGVIDVVDACYDKMNLILDPIFSSIRSLDFLYYLIQPFMPSDPGRWGHIYTQWLSFFLIGAILGWIYGKIKNRKKVTVV